MRRNVPLPVLGPPHRGTSWSDEPKEKCGVVGVWGHDDAVRLTYLGMYALQHRGQEAAGIAAMSGGEIVVEGDAGLVADVFTEERIARLEAHYRREAPADAPRGAIGHTRYSTAGGSARVNTQPLLERTFDGPVSISHNGNLVNAGAWRHELSRRGRLFHTTSDTEVMIHLLASPQQRDSPDPTGAMLRNLQGAFSLVLLFKDRIEAVRDPWGWRPLVIGQFPDGSYCAASETVALEVMGARLVREVEPGEIVTIDDSGLTARRYAEQARPLARCVFEHVYFANPASEVFGQNVLSARERLGARLAEEAPADADFVMPMPDSGRSAAGGYARESGIPYREGIVPNRYVGRTFIKPTQAERDAAVRLKLNVVSEIVRGKRVVIVDDSIVRGTTTREKMKHVREAGAEEIHVRISCPPIISPCYFGVDFASREQLIAHERGIDEIRDFLGVDSLRYLSLEGMLAEMRHPDEDYCTACFTGRYPVDPDAPLACEITTKGQRPLFASRSATDSALD